MPNATNVSVGKPKVGGAVYAAPVGTTLPTSATESLNAAFDELGYVSEDGLTNSNSPESETVKAWGGDNVLNIQTDRPDNWSLTLIESLKKEVLETVYGASNVTVDGSSNITVKATAGDMPSMAWVFDIILKGGRARRIVIPNGTISELGDIVYKDNEAIAYNVTLTDVPDTNGVYHYEYTTATAPSI